MPAVRRPGAIALITLMPFVALAVLVALAMCGGRRDPPARSAAPAVVASVPGAAAANATGAGAADAGGAGLATAVDAAGDAAADDADSAASDALVAGAPWPVEVGPKIPGFGCIGWSRARGALACVLGGSYSDTGITVSLDVVPTRGNVGRIESLAVLESRYYAEDEFPRDKIAPFREALHGFAPIDRSASRIGSRWAGDGVDKLVVDPPVTAGGATLRLQLVREGTAIFAPKHRATLWIRFAGHSPILISEVDAAISGIEARLLVLDGAVFVERIYRIGDEGTYGTSIDLWRCTPDQCDDAAPL